MADNKFIAELLLMQKIYAKHAQRPKAKKLLRDIIRMEDKLPNPDKYTLGLAFFNLSELYAEEQNYTLARDLQQTAAELWDGQTPDPRDSDPLWFSRALAALQQETQDLIFLAQATSSQVKRA